MYRRRYYFTMEYNKNTGAKTVKVIEQLKNGKEICLKEFTHEWRAEKYVIELNSTATSKDEEVVWRY